VNAAGSIVPRVDRELRELPGLGGAMAKRRLAVEGSEGGYARRIHHVPKCIRPDRPVGLVVWEVGEVASDIDGRAPGQDNCTDRGPLQMFA
jgi:hypothetical protein